MPFSCELSDAYARIGADTAAIIDDLARMVAVDTSFPPGAGYGDFANLIEGLVVPLGFQSRRVLVPPACWNDGSGDSHGERINLIAKRPGDLPVCSIYFHVDTVPAGEGWIRPSHVLSVEGDRLYGRGSADMKGAIAAVLAALRAIREAGPGLRFDPCLLFCTDEEGGLYPGVRCLAEAGLIEGHLLNLNGGAAPRIWAGCFGSIDLLIRIVGRGGHSGDPGDAVNAVEEAVPLLNALMALKRCVEIRVSAMPSPPHFCGRPLAERLTVAAMHGGQKGSSIPARFEMRVNRRYAPEEDGDAVLAELQDTINQAMLGTRALEVRTHVVGHLTPVSDPGGPHWPRWQAALGRAFAYPEGTFRAWGASTSSDMGYVQSAGIREILLGGLTRPGCNAHAPDEFTTLADVVALGRAILLYLSADFEAAETPL